MKNFLLFNHPHGNPCEFIINDLNLREISFRDITCKLIAYGLLEIPTIAHDDELFFFHDEESIDKYCYSSYEYIDLKTLYVYAHSNPKYGKALESLSVTSGSKFKILNSNYCHSNLPHSIPLEVAVSQKVINLKMLHPVSNKIISLPKVIPGYITLRFLIRQLINNGTLLPLRDNLIYCCKDYYHGWEYVQDKTLLELKLNDGDVISLSIQDSNNAVEGNLLLSLPNSGQKVLLPNLNFAVVTGNDIIKHIMEDLSEYWYKSITSWILILNGHILNSALPMSTVGVKSGDELQLLPSLNCF